MESSLLRVPRLSIQMIMPWWVKAARCAEVGTYLGVREVDLCSQRYGENVFLDDPPILKTKRYQ